jgi:hypothetical protein
MLLLCWSHVEKFCSRVEDEGYEENKTSKMKKKRGVDRSHGEIRVGRQKEAIIDDTNTRKERSCKNRVKESLFSVKQLIIVFRGKKD